MANNTFVRRAGWEVILPLILAHREQLGLADLSEVSFLLYLLDASWHSNHHLSIRAVAQLLVCPIGRPSAL